MKRYEVDAFGMNEDPTGYYVTYDDAIAAIQQAVLKEREACANVCAKQATDPVNEACPRAATPWWPDQVVHRCAEAIRARGKS